MSRCLTCGADLPEQARFCSACGTPFRTARELGRAEEQRWKAIIPTDISAVEPVMKQPQTPLPFAYRQQNTGPYVQSGLPNGPAHSREEEEKPRQTGSGGLAGAEVSPAPSASAIQGGPQFRANATRRGTSALPGNAPLTYYPTTGAYRLASRPLAPPTHLPEGAGPAGQATAARAARGSATRWVLALLILVAIAAIAGGSSLATHILTRPQPIISVSSVYTVGQTPAGSNGTSLHLTGQKFSSQSAITFLLDGRAAPDAPRALSDQNGNVSVDLPITAAWPLGRHTLTARDAASYASQSGILVEIVAQGQAHTPGPNGAPPDDASFTLNNSVQGQYESGSGPFSGTENLLVTGHPAGGSVCKERDNGQPQHLSGLTTASGLPMTEDLTLTCDGSYKSGQISYSETLQAAVVTMTDQGNSYVCHLLTMGIVEKLSGSYQAASGFSGTVTYSSFPQSDFSCTNGQLAAFNFSIYGGSGTWNGTYTRT